MVQETVCHVVKQQFNKDCNVKIEEINEATNKLKTSVQQKLPSSLAKIMLWTAKSVLHASLQDSSPYSCTIPMLIPGAQYLKSPITLSRSQKLMCRKVEL